MAIKYNHRTFQPYFTLTLLIGLLSIPGCNLLESDKYSLYEITGHTFKVEQYYFVNHEQSRFDTSQAANLILTINGDSIPIDSTGFFSKENIPPGNVRLTIESDEYKSWDTTFSLQQNLTLPIYLDPIDNRNYHFRGTLQYIDRRTHLTPDAIASMRKDGALIPIYFGRHWVRTDSSGSFYYQNMEAGSYTFGVYSNNFEYDDTTITLNQNIWYNPQLKKLESAQPLTN